MSKDKELKCRRKKIWTRTREEEVNNNLGKRFLKWRGRSSKRKRSEQEQDEVKMV